MNVKRGVETKFRLAPPTHFIVLRMGSGRICNARLLRMGGRIRQSLVATSGRLPECGHSNRGLFHYITGHDNPITDLIAMNNKKETTP